MIDSPSPDLMARRGARLVALALLTGCSSSESATRWEPPNFCALPFDAGPCEGAVSVYAFVDGECVPRTYGGCEGNDNRFPTMKGCIDSCEGPPGPDGCSGGRVFKSICVACGPAGGCGEFASVCAQPCDAATECATSWYRCADGSCQAAGCE